MGIFKCSSCKKSYRAEKWHKCEDCGAPLCSKCRPENNSTDCIGCLEVLCDSCGQNEMCKKCFDACADCKKGGTMCKACRVGW